MCTSNKVYIIFMYFTTGAARTRIRRYSVHIMYQIMYIS